MSIANPTISANSLLNQVRASVAAEMRGVDALIVNELVSDIPLIQLITQHIVQSGGKRLRPLCVLLSARAIGYQGEREHLELAAIIEFVHTATLLHDDVVDESNKRRGRDTANALWGNQASVLVGDFLYSRAFQLLTRRSNVPIMQVLANTTNHIAEGEVLQLMNRNDPHVSEATYLSIIRRKTAELFSAATQVGAMLRCNDAKIWQSMADYGLNLGMAFQIIDDLLDYTADSEQLGKNIGDDLNEGKATMPLIYAMQHTDAHTADLIRHSIQHGGLDNLPAITKAMQESNAFAYTRSRAAAFASQAKSALNDLPESQYKNALLDLVEFALLRAY